MLASSKDYRVGHAQIRYTTRCLIWDGELILRTVIAMLPCHGDEQQQRVAAPNLKPILRSMNNCCGHVRWTEEFPQVWPEQKPQHLEPTTHRIDPWNEEKDGPDRTAILTRSRKCLRCFTSYVYQLDDLPDGSGRVVSLASYKILGRGESKSSQGCGARLARFSGVGAEEGGEQEVVADGDSNWNRGALRKSPAAKPDASSSSSHDHVARVQGQLMRELCNLLGDRENHVPGISVLHEFIVNPKPHPQVFYVRDLVGRHHPRADRTSAIEALLTKPVRFEGIARLKFFSLDVLSKRKIVSDSKTRYVSHSFIPGNVTCDTPNDRDEFKFPVYHERSYTMPFT
ncbi:hypothetical protein CCHR01_03705 [Colletotrichum chrysophilum]|uniref:Uncharacterized protein n=1 Tax=Colletotrichum chrysophilum TaxID=1836956 RepID=A0AAD9EJ32_9PEZI|nr:hypothetical protein CCHR01_03705 [Colletotrichum chrysophilum]